jgi:DNA-binding Xre family transcriptional regulator
MVSDKVRILLIKRKMTMSELADRIETTPQNLSNKLSRDNFTEKEMKAISDALACKLDINFTLEETGQQI